MNRIPVRRRVLVIAHPVERHDRRIELAHQILADVVDAVLVVPLVHLRDAGFGRLHVGRDGDVVVLPDVVQAVDGVRAHGGGRVAAAGRGRVLDGSGEVVADAEDVRGRHADLAIWMGCWWGRLSRRERLEKLTLHQVVPCGVDFGGRRAFVGGLIPE